jgi:hypothetical protein
MNLSVLRNMILKRIWQSDFLDNGKVSRRSDTIFVAYMFQDHPDTFCVSYRWVGGAGRPGSSSRVHIRQNLSDSRNGTQLLRNGRTCPTVHICGGAITFCCDHVGCAVMFIGLLRAQPPFSSHQILECNSRGGTEDFIVGKAARGRDTRSGRTPRGLTVTRCRRFMKIVVLTVGLVQMQLRQSLAEC